MKAYHFVNKTLRDGSPIPADGVWLQHTGEVVLCESGYHASKHVADAVKYAPGNTLCLVELDGTIIHDIDKSVASQRKIIARFDATELLRHDARMSALSVAHLWNMPDAVRQFLETGDESLRAAAYAAAYATAYAANAANYAAATAATAATAAYVANYAANAAAYAAANYAANAADYAATAANAATIRANNRKRLQNAVDAKFAEILQK